MVRWQKTALFGPPLLFQQLSLSPSPPNSPHTTPVVPKTSASSIFLLHAPSLLQKDMAQVVRKNASARPPALIRSTPPPPGEYSLIDHPTVAWISGSLATWSRDGLRYHLRYPPPSLLNKSTTPPYFPTVVNHAASARWLSASLLPHPLPVSTTGAVGPGRVLDGDAYCAATGPNGENAASSAGASWSRLKIVTDVVGVIEPSMPRRPQVL